MRQGFTGTQRGMTRPQASRLRETLKPGEFHHGDCIGSDEQAHVIAESLGLSTILHPPVNTAKRAYCVVHKGCILRSKDYLDRNEDIVKVTEVLIAIPCEYEERLRSGTWATIRFARKLGRPIWIIFPDGSVKKENEPAPSFFATV